MVFDTQFSFDLQTNETKWEQLLAADLLKCCTKKNHLGYKYLRSGIQSMSVRVNGTGQVIFFLCAYIL